MAQRHWVGGTANWDATAGTKWSLTNGGAGGQAVPTNADDVFFDSGSGANTITVNATSVAKSLDCTGFTGTMAGASQLTVSGSVTLVSGMTVTYTGTMIINATATLTSGTKTWTGNLTVQTNPIVYTLADDWTMGSGTTLTVGSNASAPTYNGFQFKIGGNLTVNGATVVTGTTVFLFNGTGTWSGNNQLKNPVTINTAGTLTISGAINFNGNTLTYTAGTISSSGGIINVTLTATTFTLNALFTFAGTIALTVGTTFNGTNGFSVGTFSFIPTGATQTVTLQSTNTYVVTTALTLRGTAASTFTIKSSSGGSQAIFTLNNGATQSVAYMSSTDIDSSQGQTIWSWKGVLSNTLNWALLTSQKTRGDLWSA